MDLGAYAFGTQSLTPLRYEEGSALLYVNGTVQTAPAVTAGPPLSVTGLTVPAGGSVLLLYRAEVTEFAPADAEGTVVNTVTVTSPDPSGRGDGQRDRGCAGGAPAPGSARLSAPPRSPAADS